MIPGNRSHSIYPIRVLGKQTGRCSVSSEPLLRRPDRPASVGGLTEKPTPQDVDVFLDSTVVGDDPACLLASAIQARRILEIGTLGGCSSIWLARGAGPEGRVVTLEYEPKHAEVARANLQRAGVADRVEVIVGAALDTLPTVSGGPFDLVFIDADKENNVAYVEWAVRLARPGSVIVVDNVIRDGRILEPQSDDVRVQTTRRALQVMGEHPRLDTAVLQTVGAKHWDGFAFALVQ